jgi:hypothetical protein
VGVGVGVGVGVECTARRGFRLACPNRSLKGAPNQVRDLRAAADSVCVQSIASAVTAVTNITAVKLPGRL